MILWIVFWAFVAGLVLVVALPFLFAPKPLPPAKPTVFCSHCGTMIFAAQTQREALYRTDLVNAHFTLRHPEYDGIKGAKVSVIKAV